jgi:hypothetical protein
MRSAVTLALSLSLFVRLRTDFGHEGCDGFDDALQLQVCKHPSGKIARRQL